MISLAPFAISQRLQPPDKLLVSVRGNGIQSPGEALSVSRSLSQIRQQEETQLASGAPSCLKKKKDFQLAVYLLIAGGAADVGFQRHVFVSTHFPYTHALDVLSLSKTSSVLPALHVCPPNNKTFFGATQLPPLLL